MRSFWRLCVDCKRYFRILDVHQIDPPRGRRYLCHPCWLRRKE